MKTVFFFLLFLVFLPVQSTCAERTSLSTVVINASPLGFATLANVSGEPGLFGNAFAPSASVYWTMNKTFCWQSGIDAFIVYGKDDSRPLGFYLQHTKHFANVSGCTG